MGPRRKSRIRKDRLVTNQTSDSEKVRYVIECHLAGSVGDGRYEVQGLPKRRRIGGGGQSDRCHQSNRGQICSQVVRKIAVAASRYDRSRRDLARQAGSYV